MSIQKGKKYSHAIQSSEIVHRLITEGEGSCSSPEKGVIIIFPISVSIEFLKVRHREHLWRATHECHQSKVIDDVSFFSPRLRLGEAAKMNLYKNGTRLRIEDKKKKFTSRPGFCLFPDCWAWCQAKMNKNALSRCESRLLGDKCCCQRRWCCYASFSFWIQNECYMSWCK